jgi:hypothetical protein
MTKKRFLTGIFGMALVFGLVLSGCGGDDYSSGSSYDDDDDTSSGYMIPGHFSSIWRFFVARSVISAPTRAATASSYNSSERTPCGDLPMPCRLRH